MTALAGKCEEVFMTASAAFYPGKAVMEDAAIQILIYYLFYVGS